jgi:hypothetical protein
MQMSPATSLVTPPGGNLETRFGTVLGSLERHFQLADERAASDKAEKDGKAFSKLEPHPCDDSLCVQTH